MAIAYCSHHIVGETPSAIGSFICRMDLAPPDVIWAVPRKRSLKQQGRMAPNWVRSLDHHRDVGALVIKSPVRRQPPRRGLASLTHFVHVSPAGRR
jgi:hypothetical protein